jgi:hypothetical protein
MALQDLAKATTTASLTRSNYIFVEVGGVVKRISLDNLIDVLSLDENKMILQQVAWGVPLLQTQSSMQWGVYGNTAMYKQWNEMKGRYLVTNAGNAAKLSATNSGIYADGTTLDETKGHVMVYRPRLYYLVQTDSVTGVTWLWMSTLPIGGHYLEENCTGAYLAYLNGSALTSRSGVNPTRGLGSSGSVLGIYYYWNAAQKNGADWGLADYDFQRYIQMEVLSDYGTPDAQSALGYGVGGTGNSLYSDSTVLTGLTKSLGDASGTYVLDSSTKSCHVSLHGTEDAWNWIWEIRQGGFFGASNNSAQNGTECYLYKGNRLPTSAELASTPTGDYRKVTRCTSNGYVDKMYLGEYFDTIPTAIAGTNHWADYYYQNQASGQSFFFGGFSLSGAGSGPFYVDSSNAFSGSDAAIGSRLAYYGKLNFVNGKDI